MSETDDIDLTSGVEDARRGALPGPRCPMGTMLSDASLPRRAASLRTLLATEPVSTVYRQLSAKGVDVSYQAVQRHMRGACSCKRRGIS